MSQDTASPADCRQSAHSPACDFTPTLSRRRAITAAGGLSLALIAGCLGDGNRQPVEPEDPGDDPEATPGEFYFLLEQNDVRVDELYYDTEDSDLILFYESTAEDTAESEEEIGLIYQLFSNGLIDRGAEINHLYTEVLDRFEGQVEGWGINAEWAQQHLDGEIDDIALWNGILETMVYPEGKGPEEPEDGGLELEAGDSEDGGSGGDE